MALKLDVCVTTKQLCILAIVSKSSCDTTLMHLLCCLFFMEVWFHFKLVAVHISCTLNTWADNLARDHLSSFFSKAPKMESELTPVPPLVPTLLLAWATGHHHYGQSSLFLLSQGSSGHDS